MDSNHIIDLLGGTKQVADLCEVSMQAVSQWREKGIPKARLAFLRLAKPHAFDPVAPTKASGDVAQPRACLPPPPVIIEGGGEFGVGDKRVGIDRRAIEDRRFEPTRRQDRRRYTNGNA